MNTAAHGPLLAQADLTADAAGHPASARYGDVYASRAGALGQARAVYLRGCGLFDTPPRWAGAAQFTILETGFGLGVNFLATWAAWRADPQRCAQLHYVSIELHPVRPADVLRWCPPELQPLAAELAAQWPLPVRGLHRLTFDDGRVQLLLALGDAAELAPKLHLAADALYLDGFSPARNPALWTPELLRLLARHCKPGARAASFTVAQSVRQALTQAGFDVERAPGWGGKRQRLQARFDPVWTRSRHPLPVPWPPHLPRHAVIVGAGISGAACALALAQRGWAVDVLDAAAQPASGGSAMPAGLAHLQPSADDNLLSRLTRAGMAALRRAVPTGRDDLARFAPTLLTPADDAEAQRLRDWQAQLRLPPQLAQPTAAGWCVDSAVLANRALCAHWLRTPGVRLRCGVQVARLRQDGDGWELLDAAGRLLARAPLVVLASAVQTSALLTASALIPAAQWLPLRALHGQAQALPARDWPALRQLQHAWIGRGYALRLPAAAAFELQRAHPDAGADWLLVGATFEAGGQVLSAADAWEHNRAAVAALAPTPPLPGYETALQHFSGTRATTPDRLPYCGLLADLRPLRDDPARWAGKQLYELPRLRGLAVCTGMGSRGLTLAPILAECLAAQIDGTPLPLETDLADAIDPARIALRRLRRGQAG
ncbi:MAG: FAD-dependent 5-carboxymethylaminomethyl-2-thiouridine(34) oxidoreductase MnmC [Thiomonas sp.]